MGTLSGETTLEFSSGKGVGGGGGGEFVPGEQMVLGITSSAGASY